jgi:hypothetical protein
VTHLDRTRDRLGKWLDALQARIRHDHAQLGVLVLELLQPPHLRRQRAIVLHSSN